MWSPDLLNLECQRKLIDDHSAVEDCVQLSSVSDVYRVLNETNTSTTGYSEGSFVKFQCVDTPYEIDPLFTTECQAGQWNPYPRDICNQDVTIIEYYYGIECLIFMSRYLNFYIMYSIRYCIFGSSDCSSLSHHTWDS